MCGTQRENGSDETKNVLPRDEMETNVEVSFIFNVTGSTLFISVRLLSCLLGPFLLSPVV